MNSFFQKLANLAVNYSIGIEKDQRVFVLGPTLAEELFQANKLLGIIENDREYPFEFVCYKNNF